jgi:hypothetical protein
MRTPQPGSSTRGQLATSSVMRSRPGTLVGFWRAHPYADAVARVERAPPEWTIPSWGDANERQVDANGGALVLPTAQVEGHVAWIRSRYNVPSKSYDVMETNAVAHPGETVEVNPFALRDDTGQAPSAVLRAALDRALDEVLRNPQPWPRSRRRRGQGSSADGSTQHAPRSSTPSRQASTTSSGAGVSAPTSSSRHQSIGATSLPARRASNVT